MPKMRGLLDGIFVGWSACLQEVGKNQPGNGELRVSSCEAKTRKSVPRRKNITNKMKIKKLNGTTPCIGTAILNSKQRLSVWWCHTLADEPGLLPMHQRGDPCVLVWGSGITIRVCQVLQPSTTPRHMLKGELDQMHRLPHRVTQGRIKSGKRRHWISCAWRKKTAVRKLLSWTTLTGWA